ncbi:MAG TPA: glycosyltransferase family 9 protein [Nitrospirales bacterium]|jgi:ADP-heptose:LPS heptosyltransferase
MDRTVNSLLVVHPGSLGDTILALPVLAALKERHHPASLHLIGHPSLVDVLPGRTVIDAMHSIEGPQYRELLGGSERMRPAMVEFFRPFGLIVVWAADHTGSVRATLECLGISRVVVRSPGLREDTNQHATDRFRGTVEDLLPTEELPESGLTPTENDRRSGARWLLTHGIDPESEHIIAVHAGSGSVSKCWPSDRFAVVIRALLRHRIRVVLIQGPADEEMTQAVARQVPVSLPRLRNASLATVVGVLSICDGFLGNDSGITQLATASGMPTVAVFGPTDPRIWGYRHKRLVPLRAEKACGCTTREAQQTCNGRVCLATSPAVVLNALRPLIRSAGRSLAT